MATQEPAQAPPVTAVDDNEKDYHKWTIEEEKALLEAMRLAKAAGHKSPQGFKKKGAPFMLEEIRKVMPDTNLKVVSIRNHLKTWRRQLSALLDVKALSGVGWNDVTKTFKCTDEEWKFFLKVSVTLNILVSVCICTFIYALLLVCYNLIYECIYFSLGI